MTPIKLTLTETTREYYGGRYDSRALNSHSERQYGLTGENSKWDKLTLDRNLDMFEGGFSWSAHPDIDFSVLPEDLQFIETFDLKSSTWAKAEIEMVLGYIAYLQKEFDYMHKVQGDDQYTAIITFKGIEYSTKDLLT